jgi:hypothetical protein
MKTLLVLLIWTSGLVGTLLAASSEETNGQLKLGDLFRSSPPPIRTENRLTSDKSQKVGTPWSISIRRR